MLPLHVNSIMMYAVNHKYYDVVNKAAPLFTAKPLEEVLADMPANLVVPWVGL